MCTESSRKQILKKEEEKKKQRDFLGVVPGMYIARDT